MRNFYKLFFSTNSFFKFVVVCFFVINNTVFAQSVQENYILSKTYKIETSASIPAPNASQADVVIQYFDGLGRTKQEVAHRMAGNGGDLITHITYDALGRPVKEYLPLVRSASLELQDGDLPSQVEAYYSDSAPYSETVYENSALGRVVKEQGPGSDWKLSGDQAIYYSYETNTTNDIHHFGVELSGSSPTLKYYQKYPVGQLYKTVTKNENWKQTDGKLNTTEEYKNKMGQVVLRRSFIVKTDGFRGSVALDTYYVYDIFGNLTFVLPPKLSKQIPTDGIPSKGQMNALAYQYKYDHRNRMIEKKIPGRKKENIHYDLLDRLIATGPVLSPFGAGVEGRIITKYDQFDRVVYTMWQQGIGDIIPSGIIEPAASLSESRTSGTTTINGVSLNYTNNIQPKTGEILTVHYYDDYLYADAPSPIPSGVGEGNAITIEYDNQKKPLGLPTGSWTRVLETASQKQGVKNYMLYDQKARPARVATLYPDSGKTITDTEFNFIGDPNYTLTTHKKNASADEFKVKETYTYTAQGRLNFVRHQINNESPRILSLNTYDDLGRLLIKRVGRTSVLSSDELQIVDYKYNIRGWLTDINNVNNLNQPGGGPVDLFAFKINYHTVTDNINGQVEPLYNGNISETFWRTATDNIKRKYGYSYDHQHRLTAAYYQLPGTVIPRSDSYSTSYSYDENGNILSLKRNGKEDDPNLLIEIDDLDYTYDQGNRLLKVKDATGNPAGFNMNGAHINDQYDYDDYGNLKTDPYKKISNITYNHLNLPVQITFTGGETVEYTYLADGTKLKKTATDSENNTTTTEYRDGFQYKNNILEFFPHAEGYVKSTESVNGYIFNYVFTHTDHLGNIRIKYTKHPQTGELQILEEDHYYPYGLTHEGYSGNHQIFGFDDHMFTLIDVTPDVTDTYKYKFNGMEWQDEFDVNVYDFGARNYDPALGRWMNIDPLAEMMRRHSPYNYAFNNPVFFIDPDGMFAMAWGMQMDNVSMDNGGGYKTQNSDDNGGSSGYNVWTLDKDNNTLDEVSTNGRQGVNIHADGNIDVINDTGYSEISSPDSGGGGDAIACGCPTPPCDGNDNNVAQLDIEIKILGGAGALEYIGGGGFIKAASLLRNVKLAGWIKNLISGGKATKTGANLTKSQLKSISSLESQIATHQTKLAEYIKNPMKFDNKGFLKNAPNDAIRQKIIQSRINHLNKEIKTFQNNIQKILNGQ